MGAPPPEKRPQKRAKKWDKTCFLCISAKLYFFWHHNREKEREGENLGLTLWKTLWKLRKTRFCKGFYPHCPQNRLWKTRFFLDFSVSSKKSGIENDFFQNFLLTENRGIFPFSGLRFILRIFEIFFVKKGDFLSYFSRKCVALP